MTENREPISTYTIRNLMLTALGYEKEDLDPEGKYFKLYNYSGTQDDLFRLTEALAIRKGLIEEKVKLSNSPWASIGQNLFEYRNTNFQRKEIERLFEVFSQLLNQNIIAPGMYRNSSFLPFFHVTDHGMECIKQVEILPYDYDGYITKLKNISGIDMWVLSYMTEAIQCFNAGSFNAANIMVGLSAEKIVLDLIDAFKNYLTKYKGSLVNKPTLSFTGNIDQAFITDVDKVWQISLKYGTFLKYFNGIKNHDNSITKIGDKNARNTFYDYIRLLRNEVSHPSDIKKSETETLLLFVSFIKYIDLQTQLTETLKNI